MALRRWFILLLLPVLGACSIWRTDYPDTLTADVTHGWHVDRVNVFVLDDLTTTEANRLIPDADIVWHGEAYGDRRVQVAAILDEAVTAAAAGLSGPRHVDLDVRLVEFHAVTPAAVNRAPTAVHNIRFVIQARDTTTNQIIAGPDMIVSQLEAYTGPYAAVAAAEGRGQRVRIIDHLTRTVRGWLADGPDIRERYVSIGR